MRNLIPAQFILKCMLGLIFGLVLFNCTSYPKVNLDPAKNNKSTFENDALDCAKAYPEVDAGVQIKQRIGCMNLKGWR